MASSLSKDDFKSIQNIVDDSIDKFSIHLFRYLAEEFKRIDRNLDLADIKRDRYANVVVDFAAQTEKHMQEFLALGNKVDRHEKWISQLSDGADIKLVPEV